MTFVSLDCHICQILNIGVDTNDMSNRVDLVLVTVRSIDYM